MVEKLHTDDYKLAAVKLYLKLSSIRQTCEYLGCSKSSLQRWIERYFEYDTVSNKEYKKRGSKVKDEHLEFIKNEIKKNPTIILSKIQGELLKKKKLDISLSYVFYLIKYKLKITHKQLRSKYYPGKKLETLKVDKKKFYKSVIDKGIENIISIDETGFYLNMTKNYGRSSKGKRCYKTVYKYPYVKFNFICAIKYGKVIGSELYVKNSGGINATAFNNFYNNNIKNKYKNHLIILDNARFHRTTEVTNNIEASGNKVIYTLAYNPNLNPIENFFSQLKNHVKNTSPMNYDDLKAEIKNVIKNKISKNHMENYFKYLFLQANKYMKK